jgi:predicted MPP superfamily phosphohydrolase
MLILHISDIHFRAPHCLDPDQDPDRPYRTRLLRDVRALVAEHGPVSAILIGGDIAFKGAPEEYRTAMVWIRELAAVAGCPLERVFVIPGNHDVDRSVILNNAAVRNVQAAIARARGENREGEFRTQIRDADTAHALLKPIEAYNDFAKILNCQVYLPDRLYWKQGIDLEGGVVLRMHGLTSTLLSGAEGRDDTRDSLYLSPLQTVLDPAEDVVNLVLCHHPPDWLMDQDAAEDAICGRAVVQLFGHKHRQRIAREVDYVRFSAGAVNPDRNELLWQPGYNLIDLRVRGVGPNRVLAVDAHLRQWQSNPDLFRPVLTQAGETVFRHTIRFPEPPRAVAVIAAAVPAAAAVAPGTDPAGQASALPESSCETLPGKPDADVEAAMGDASTRNLVFRFWNLTTSQRREIALGIGLISDAELGLPEPERYGRALIRAGERGQLDQLAREIAEKETH